MKSTVPTKDTARQSVANGIVRLANFTGILIAHVALAGNAAAAGAAAPANTAPPSSTTSSSSLADTTIHLYYVVSGYVDPLDTTSPSATYCSARSAQLKVGADDGTRLTVAVDNEKKENEDGIGACAGKYVSRYHQYTIAKSDVLNASPTIQGFVSGVLAVPFKYHIADRALTAGSTVGGYVGYRTSVANQFAITPVVGGGLALISTAPAQVSNSSTSASQSQSSTSSSSTQTSAGVSIATGLIGSVTSAASKGAQFGILVGVDWLGKKRKIRL